MDFYHTDVRGITFGCRARRISRSCLYVSVYWLTTFLFRTNQKALMLLDSLVMSFYGGHSGALKCYCIVSCK